MPDCLCHVPDSPRGLDVALGILAVHRLTRFLSTDGFPPVKAVRDAVKRQYGSDSPVTELATCVWCQSLWLAPLVALALKRWPSLRWVLLGPAISSGVGLLSTLDSYLSVSVDEPLDLTDRLRAQAH